MSEVKFKAYRDRYSVRVAVEKSILDVSAYDRNGSLEKIEERIDRLADNFGLLIQTLSDKGLLNTDEVSDFVRYPFTLME
jgi:hypothetical protein